MKRFIALFLTLALLVSCVPAALAAEDEVPEETPALLFCKPNCRRRL